MEAKGICADYNDGLEWMSARNLDSSTEKGQLEKQLRASHHVILFMGSSLGNIPRPDAQALLNRIVDTGMRSGDMILVGLDQCQDADLVVNSYSDVDGLATQLYRNGIRNAAKQARIEGLLKPEDFEYYGVYNHTDHRHEVTRLCLPNMTLVVNSVISSVMFVRSSL